MRVAVIAGASGLIGKQLMFKLLENKEYSKVYALIRNPFEIKHPKLVQLSVDYTDLDKLDLPDRVTDAFCCLGTTMKNAGSKEAFYKVDYTYVLNFASHFLKKGATQFLLVSANGADPTSSIYYSRVKGEVEQSLKALGYESMHIFRPSILMGARQEFRLGERIGIALAMLFRPFMLGSLQKYKPIYASQVAFGMMSRALMDRKGIFIYESNEI